MGAFIFPKHVIPSPLLTHYRYLPNPPTSLSVQFYKGPLPLLLYGIYSYYPEKTSIPKFTTSSSSAIQVDETDSSSYGGLAPPLLKKRKRYRKEYPGESKGITEEMRFVAMKLRNDKGSIESSPVGVWESTMEGFLKYLVDSKLVFQTLETILEDSNDVSYAYFRRTGLERTMNLASDLLWFSQQGMTIPEPCSPGVTYSLYLKDLAEKSAPLFLSHLYNVYFSHIAGGQVIAKQVAEKLLKEKQLDFFYWEGDEQEFLKEVRQKLNRLSEHWSRDDKNKCLKEATKSYRYLGQIVRLIIL